MLWRVRTTLPDRPGALAVLAGAFAAHALSARLDPRMLSAFTTGCTGAPPAVGVKEAKSVPPMFTTVRKRHDWPLTS